MVCFFYARLTGAYRELPSFEQSNSQASAEVQGLTHNPEDSLTFSLVYDTQTSNTFGSVYSVYTFSLHTALDSLAF